MRHLASTHFALFTHPAILMKHLSGGFCRICWKKSLRLTKFAFCVDSFSSRIQWLLQMHVSESKLNPIRQWPPERWQLQKEWQGRKSKRPALEGWCSHLRQHQQIIWWTSSLRWGSQVCCLTSNLNNAAVGLRKSRPLKRTLRCPQTLQVC